MQFSVCAIGKAVRGAAVRLRNATAWLLGAARQKRWLSVVRALH